MGDAEARKYQQSRTLEIPKQKWTIQKWLTSYLEVFQVFKQETAREVTFNQLGC